MEMMKVASVHLGWSERKFWGSNVIYFICAIDGLNEKYGDGSNSNRMTADDWTRIKEKHKDLLARLDGKKS